MSKPTKSKRTPLAQAREKKGWTQGYLADLLNVSLDTVRQWERGRHLPYQATIQKLCEIFEKTPEELGLLKEQSTSTSLESNKSSLHLLERDEHEQQTFRVPNLTSIPSSDAIESKGSNELTLPQTTQSPAEPSEVEGNAAWEMYIELVTRVPVAVLGQDEGLLREALSSLYSLFNTTRAILRRSGPAIARTDKDKDHSVSCLAVRMLNTTLRPLLTKWHPLLQDYEAMRPDSVSITQHERLWERYTELRQELSTIRKALIEYASLFAQMAGVSASLLISDDMLEVKPRLLRVEVG